MAQLVENETGELIDFKTQPAIQHLSKKVWDAAQNNITLVDNYTGIFCIADFWSRDSYYRYKSNIFLLRDKTFLKSTFYSTLKTLIKHVKLLLVLVPLGFCLLI